MTLGCPVLGSQRPASPNSLQALCCHLRLPLHSPHLPPICSPVPSLPPSVVALIFLLGLALFPLSRLLFPPPHFHVSRKISTLTPPCGCLAALSEVTSSARLPPNRQTSICKLSPPCPLLVNLPGVLPCPDSCFSVSVGLLFPSPRPKQSDSQDSLFLTSIYSLQDAIPTSRSSSLPMLQVSPKDNALHLLLLGSNHFLRFPETPPSRPSGNLPYHIAHVSHLAACSSKP